MKLPIRMVLFTITLSLILLCLARQQQLYAQDETSTDTTTQVETQAQPDTGEADVKPIEAEIDWIRNNLSPTGGKVAFRKTQKEQMTKKPRSGWLTKDD